MFIRFNIIAVTELYESIKFQCSNCGMRFVRNEQLKAHLDAHFTENNETRKKKKHNPTSVECRPNFNSFNSWVSTTEANNNNPNPTEVKECVNIVAFTTGCDSNCFMCKEPLSIEKDGISNQLSTNEADENCYFINAKKIRVSLKNKVSQQIEKKEVTVHVECMRQLEDIKQQREMAKQKQEILGKRVADLATDKIEKRQKIDEGEKASIKGLLDGLAQS